MSSVRVRLRSFRAVKLMGFFFLAWIQRSCSVCVNNGSEVISMALKLLHSRSAQDNEHHASCKLSLNDAYWILLCEPKGRFLLIRWSFHSAHTHQMSTIDNMSSVQLIWSVLFHLTEHVLTCVSRGQIVILCVSPEWHFEQLDNKFLFFFMIQVWSDLLSNRNLLLAANSSIIICDHKSLCLTVAFDVFLPPPPPSSAFVNEQQQEAALIKLNQMTMIEWFSASQQGASPWKCGMIDHVKLNMWALLAALLHFSWLQWGTWAMDGFQTFFRRFIGSPNCSCPMDGIVFFVPRNEIMLVGFGEVFWMGLAFSNEIIKWHTRHHLNMLAHIQWECTEEDAFNHSQAASCEGGS